MSSKIKEFQKQLSKGIDVPYLPEDGTGMIYNDIKWGAIAIDSFIFAVLFMCVALLKKVTPCVWVCYVVMITGIIFIVAVNIYLISKRKTVQ